MLEVDATGSLGRSDLVLQFIERTSAMLSTQQRHEDPMSSLPATTPERVVQRLEAAASAAVTGASPLDAFRSKGATRETFFRGLGTATPPNRFSKADCLVAFRDSSWYSKLNSRARFIAHTVLERDNGIDERRLAVDDLRDVFTIDPDTLATRFSTHAPALASDAAWRALDDSGVAAASIDAVIVSTCTGYLCPGLSGYVVERLGLRADVMAFDLVGQGCAAALPNLQLGHNLLRSGSCDHVLSICVEVSSAAMYLDSDPGVIISACLFGDGAGAAVLSSQRGGFGPEAGSASAASRQIRWVDSASLIEPKQRDALRFEQRQGLLRNILTRKVPALASAYAARVLGTVLQRSGLQTDDIGTWIMHAGGRDVLRAIEADLGLDPADLRYSASMLREYGNLSSAFVYFVLQAARADGAVGGWWWLSSFGAGFSCHGALLEVR